MLETKIEALTQAIVTLTELISKIEAGKAVVESAPVIVKAEKFAPVVEAPAPVVEAAPVMPAAPTFEPVVEAASVDCPITDGKSLIDFVMTVYKELGAEKGSKIQGVLTEMGLQNVNEVRPTEYVEFYQKVMALKG